MVMTSPLIGRERSQDVTEAAKAAAAAAASATVTAMDVRCCSLPAAHRHGNAVAGAHNERGTETKLMGGFFHSAGSTGERRRLKVVRSTETKGMKNKRESNKKKKQSLKNQN